jgi:hypothetical protein
MPIPNGLSFFCSILDELRTHSQEWAAGGVTVLGDFVSQEYGVPHDGPKDSNVGGYTREI